VETIFSTAWSVSVTRSAARGVSLLGCEGRGGERRGGRTVFLGAGGEVGGCCGHHHAARLVGDGDEEIVDLLQVDFGHFGELRCWKSWKVRCG
jgi:hypothetical protein